MDLTLAEELGAPKMRKGVILRLRLVRPKELNRSTLRCFRWDPVVSLELLFFFFSKS